MKNYELGRSRRVLSVEAVTPSSISIILHKILSLVHLLLSNWGSISCSCSYDILRSPGDGLGPLLFLMYINDLRDGLNSTVRLFADDALLYGTICCDEDAADPQHDLFWLEAWQQKLKREFHPLKCKIVWFTTKRDPQKGEYIFCGEILEEVESHPYLGVVFDNEWDGSPHIEVITSTWNNVLGLIKRNMWNCPKSVKETAYTTLVRPKLQYACSAWDLEALF